MAKKFKTPGDYNATINKWRNAQGVDAPLRIGRGIRTRDEFFAGQNKKKIHEEIHKDELYRRAVVLDIDDDENLAVVKTHIKPTSKHPFISGDSQNRKYERIVQTASGEYKNYVPIRLEKNKFELAPARDDITIEQAEIILQDIEKTSSISKKRLKKFRKNKKKTRR